MKALDACGKFIGQQVGCDTETATWSTGIVEFGLNLGVLGVDTDSARDRVVGLGGRLIETVVLRERVERDMAAATHHLTELLGCVGWRKSMCPAAELLKGKACLMNGACSYRIDILAEDRETLPQRECLEGKDYLYTGLACHAAYEFQITAQQRLFHHITG